MSFGIKKTVILNIHGLHYPHVIFVISKSEAIDLLRKAGLNEKCRSLENMKKVILLVLAQKTNKGVLTVMPQFVIITPICNSCPNL